jgi:hypothetical protein
MLTYADVCWRMLTQGERERWRARERRLVRELDELRVDKDLEFAALKTAQHTAQEKRAEVSVFALTYADVC